MVLGACDLGSAATFTVTTTEDAGTNSLRQAILDANANPGTDTIEFAIIGAFAQTITPLTPLPTITDPIEIDGYTQPGASENTLADDNNAELLIVLDGSDLGLDANGLHITAGHSTVRGLVINNFAGTGAMGNGIRLETGPSNVVAGCFIGVDESGFFDEPNRVGIYIASAGNTIGGTTPQARNVISGNQTGVLVAGAAASDNRVLGNFIGTDDSGTFAMGNTLSGVTVKDASGNSIGGDAPSRRNVISGNATGVLLDGAGASNNVVQANFIGVDAPGQSDLGNAIGVRLQAAAANLIGGTNQFDRNIVAGNTTAGLQFSEGAAQNSVQGNFIGVVPVASTADAVPNRIGVDLADGVSNVIGGTVAAAANVIAGNDADGVRVGFDAAHNMIQGNFIGTDSAGNPDLGNAGNGLLISGTDNLVGGTAAGAGNIIAYNEGNGVTVSNVNNQVLANAIFTNALLGIDLDGNGVTTNDVGDADSGGNHRQNFPVLTNASSCTGIAVAGTLHTTPNTDCELEFFRNDLCDASGYGEGQALLGWTNVLTDVEGNAAFAVTYTNAVATGEFITATATTATAGDTSEFSACLEVDRVLCVEVTRAADENCQAVVAPEELDAGTLDPCGHPVSLSASPAGPYPPGTNLVVVTAMADGYTNDCVARVIVLDQTRPELPDPPDLVRTAGPLMTNRVVIFDPPPATDNCSAVTVTCAPPAGTAFSLGTNLVAVTATDSAGNSTNAAFNLIVLPFGVVSNDLAVTRLSAPRRIRLSALRPSRAGRASVSIQNRSAHDETIPDLATLANLVQLSVESLGDCGDPTPALRPPRRFPIVLRPKQSRRVTYDVTFNCANDHAAGAGHEDFRYTVTLNRAAIDGQPDGHPDDDYGPREPLPSGVDANPDGRVRDRGVGARRADRTLGGPVLTDIQVR